MIVGRNNRRGSGGMGGGGEGGEGDGSALAHEAAPAPALLNATDADREVLLERCSAASLPPNLAARGPRAKAGASPPRTKKGGSPRKEPPPDLEWQPPAGYTWADLQTTARLEQACYTPASTTS